MLCLLSDMRGCCVELAEEDEKPAVRMGAQEILAALSGETLRRGSHPEPIIGRSISCAPLPAWREAKNGAETLLRSYTDPISDMSENTSSPISNEIASEIVNDIINDHTVVVIRGKTLNRLARLLRRKL